VDERNALFLLAAGMPGMRDAALRNLRVMGALFNRSSFVMLGCFFVIDIACMVPLGKTPTTPDGDTTATAAVSRSAIRPTFRQSDKQLIFELIKTNSIC
jgi:hypothetical protein